MTGYERLECPCVETHVGPLEIAPALTAIPRRWGTFAEFRSAMLADVRRFGALDGWDARDEGDLGRMLIEMWAYVCDVCSFYDETIAHELFVRTARRDVSVRRLLALLGYRRRPAVAAQVRLAVLVSRARSVPRGTAFRSQAFDDEPPQIYETLEDAAVHYQNNRWIIPRTKRRTLVTGLLSRTWLPPLSRVPHDAPILLYHRTRPDESEVPWVARVDRVEEDDGERYSRVQFDEPARFAPGTSVDELTAYVPSRSVPLRTRLSIRVEGLVGSTMALRSSSGAPMLGAGAHFEAGAQLVPGRAPAVTTLTLPEYVREIREGELVLVARGRETRWFRVSDVSEAVDMVDVERGGNLPFVARMLTRITLDASLNDPRRRGDGPIWNASRDPLVVYHSLRPAGAPDVPGAPDLRDTDDLRIETPVTRRSITRRTLAEAVDAGLAHREVRRGLPVAIVRAPRVPDGVPVPRKFLIRDADERGVEVGGRIERGTRRFFVDAGDGWDPPLAAAASLYGNTVLASHGETVADEVLGSGDAGVPSQRFKLARKPLTYIASPSAASPNGIRSTVELRVGGILWREVPTFFTAGPLDAVYVVVNDDAGDSFVVGGDGVRGMTFPTGVDNVVATYRVGAGAKSPPAGSITQLVRPTLGLTSVSSPVAPSGGADPQTKDEMRRDGPRSALTLGRAVSMVDMEAVAGGIPGVRAAYARWHWHASAQRPVAQIWYVGDEGLAATVRQSLRALTDPSTPIRVERALPIPVRLEVSVELDPAWPSEEVLDAVRKALIGEEVGLLLPVRLGLGAPVYRSAIVRCVLDVPGVVSVQSLGWNRTAFDGAARRARPGAFFDFEAGGVHVNDRGTTYEPMPTRRVIAATAVNLLRELDDV